MTIAKGAIAKVKITSVRELVREDLEVLRRPRHSISTPQKLRDSHHRVARLVAAGLRTHEVAERTGYSLARLDQLRKTPAFQELVSSYRNKHDEAYAKSLDDYYDYIKTNALKAERRIGDRLDDEEEDIPIRELVAISRDAADRIGYGKKQMNVNLNVDFAMQLEKAIKRSGKAIEGTAISPALTSSLHAVGSAPTQDAPRTSPPLLRRRA
jgi:hypothetical protein